MIAVNLTRATDAPVYSPPGHRGVVARRLQGAEAGGPEGFWVGRSTYPPGARADLAPVAGDTVYVLLAGELTLVVDGVPEASLLTPGDSVFLARGTVRAVQNRTAQDAILLVVLQSEGV